MIAVYIFLVVSALIIGASVVATIAHSRDVSRSRARATLEERTRNGGELAAHLRADPEAARAGAEDRLTPPPFDPDPLLVNDVEGNRYALRVMRAAAQSAHDEAVAHADNVRELSRAAATPFRPRTARGPDGRFVPHARP